MSHFTRVATKFLDAGILSQALVDMGCEEAQGTTVRGYNGKTETAERVFRVKRPDGTASGYDVGFARGQDGAYEIVTDWWGLQYQSGRNIEQEPFMAELTKKYSKAKILGELGRKGYRVASEASDADGNLKLTVERSW